MRSVRKLQVFNLLITVLHVAAAAAKNDDDDACGLYVAKSTLPDAGLGIFTATERRSGQTLESTADTCVPFIDMYWHQPEHLQSPYRDDYYWNGRALGMTTESKTGTVEAFCPGMVSLLNCHAGLVNVIKPGATHEEENNLKEYPGTQSPYGVHATKIARPIPVGGELFSYYNDEWLMGQVRSSDYDAVVSLLHQISRVVYDDTVPYKYVSENVTVIIKARNTVVEKLPPTLQSCLTATILATDDTETSYRNNTRDLSWLQEHGRCIDHIVRGRSTIPHGGIGAFAKHNLQKGQIITTSPLHHFADHNIMNVYNITKHAKKFPVLQTTEEEEEEREDEGFHYQRHVDKVINHQLAVNYCFGNDQTMLLLCPYGVGVNYINHSPNCNVKIRWAEGFDGHDSEVVRTATLEDLEDIRSPILAFDYVATRDIQVGEELFIDYGTGWHQAWLQHQEDSAVKRSEQYASAHQWNKKFATVPIRTDDEQVLDPYPEHIQVRCHYNTVSAGPSAPSDIFEWRIDYYGYPCTIVDRFIENGMLLYTVDVEMWPEPGYNNVLPPLTQVKRVLRTDIPREALRFFDVPGTSDLNMVATFRHFIELPDDMLPEQWKYTDDDEEEEAGEEEEEEED